MVFYTSRKPLVWRVLWEAGESRQAAFEKGPRTIDGMEEGAGNIACWNRNTCQQSAANARSWWRRSRAAIDTSDAHGELLRRQASQSGRRATYISYLVETSWGVKSDLIPARCERAFVKSVADGICCSATALQASERTECIRGWCCVVVRFEEKAFRLVIGFGQEGLFGKR